MSAEAVYKLCMVQDKFFNENQPISVWTSWPRNNHDAAELKVLHGKLSSKIL